MKKLIKKWYFWIGILIILCLAFGGGTIEEEVSMILQSLDFYEEHNIHLREEHYDIVNNIRTKVDKVL